MLTIFGKKKKDETGDLAGQSLDSASPTSQMNRTPIQGSAPGSSPSSAPPLTPPSSPAPIPSQQSSPVQPTAKPVPVPTAPSPQIFRASPNAPLPAEETSLTRLLQSLLADIPLPPDVDQSFGAPQVSADFVPVRSTPPSRPMVIGPSKDTEAWEEQNQPAAKQPTPAPLPGKPVKPVEVQQPISKAPPPPSATLPVTAKKDQPSDKPSKIDKPAEPPAKPTKVTRTPQGFDHIFQLTQGNLENAGLVVINAPAGTGRTTLCSGLTGNYMKNGNPCLYLTCDQSPSDLRDQMKKLGTDAAQFESGFKLILVDGFSSQSESFSMEMYYVDQPFNFETITDALSRSAGMFIGDKIRIIFDSVDSLASKVQGKDFVKGFTDLVTKQKDSGATFIVTVDLSKLSKDVASSLSDLADCVIDLSGDDSDPNRRALKVQRLNHSSAKVDPETFELDANKGLVFV